MSAVFEQDIRMPARNGTERARSFEIMLPSEDIPPLHTVNTCFGPVRAGHGKHTVAPDEPESRCELSLRAINVLKMLSDELMGEVPPRQDWVPSDELLRKITVERLSLARNCGPRTVDEIVRWAGVRGVTIQRLLHAGKSLSDTWRDLGDRFAADELTTAELAEALERSVRRKSTKIPVAIQRVLLKYLSKDPERG
jgi:hypothetical protein